MSHHVYELSFGPHYPGIVNPLDGFERIITVGKAFQEYKYFIKVCSSPYGRYVCRKLCFPIIIAA